MIEFYFASTIQENDNSLCIRWYASDLNLKTIASAYCYVNGTAFQEDHLKEYVDYIYNMTKMYHQPWTQLYVNNRYIYCTIDLLLLVFENPKVISATQDMTPSFYPVSDIRLDAHPIVKNAESNVHPESAGATMINSQNAYLAEISTEPEINSLTTKKLATPEIEVNESKIQYNMDYAFFYNANGSFVSAANVPVPATRDYSVHLNSPDAYIDYRLEKAIQALTQPSSSQAQKVKYTYSLFCNEKERRVVQKTPKYKKSLHQFKYAKDSKVHEDKKRQLDKTYKENSCVTNSRHKV